MDIKSIMNSDFFRKIEDDFNDITSIVYSRNFHHMGGSNISYIKFIENKIYILHVTTAGFGPDLVHLFESIVTKDEFIYKLKKLNINKWKFDYPPDNTKGIGLYGEGFYIDISINSKMEYTYTGRGEKPETYYEFAKLIGLLFNSVRKLKIFGISGYSNKEWSFSAIDNYIAKKRITGPNGKSILRIDKNINSIDGRIENIEYSIQEWKWANSYVVEIVDGKPVTINSFNKMAIGWNELSRGNECRKNKNYELALKYYKSAIEIDNNNQAKFYIAEMIANGEISLEKHPELEMYVVPPKKTTIEDVIAAIRKSRDSNR